MHFKFPISASISQAAISAANDVALEFRKYLLLAVLLGLGYVWFCPATIASTPPSIYSPGNGPPQVSLTGNPGSSNTMPSWANGIPQPNGHAGAPPSIYSPSNSPPQVSLTGNPGSSGLPSWATPTGTPPSSLVSQGVGQGLGQFINGVASPISQSPTSSGNWIVDSLRWFFTTFMGETIGNWLNQLVGDGTTNNPGWVTPMVQLAFGALTTLFSANPNYAVDKNPFCDIVRQTAQVIYAVATDLLLLLFILCIWKYWTDAAWRGAGNLMGAVGRLIFTAGLMLAWPTVFAFVIQIGNELANAIMFNPSHVNVIHYVNGSGVISVTDGQLLSSAISLALKGAVLAFSGLAFSVVATLGGATIGGLAGLPFGIAPVTGAIGGIIGTMIGFIGELIFVLLGGILIGEIIGILVLKAVQLALLAAQYMLAPVFLVFYAMPDTERIATMYVRSFVEVSLWTFVWLALFKLMCFIITFPIGTWPSILMAIGILQLMIQVPGFMARGQISPISDFITTGLVLGAFLGGAQQLKHALSNGMSQIGNFIANPGARGVGQTANVPLQGLGGAMTPARAQALQSLRDMAHPQNPIQAPPLGALGTAAAGAGPLAMANAMNTAGAGAGGLNMANAMGGAAGAMGGGAFGGGVPGMLAGGGAMGGGGGGGGGTPWGGPKDIADDRVRSGVGYVHPDIRAMMKDVILYQDGMTIMKNPGSNQPRITIDRAGHIGHLGMPLNGTANDSAYTMAVGGLSRLMRTNPGADGAARQSAIDAGGDRPLGFRQGMASVLLAATGGDFRQSQVAYENFNRAKAAAAIAGSEAYMRGDPGNAYTGFLRSSLGDLTDADFAQYLNQITDDSLSESPANMYHHSGNLQNIQAGIMPDEQTRAVGAHPWIRQSRPNQRNNYVNAVLGYARARLATDPRYMQMFPMASATARGMVNGTNLPDGNSMEYISYYTALDYMVKNDINSDMVRDLGKMRSEGETNFTPQSLDDFIRRNGGRHVALNDPFMRT